MALSQLRGPRVGLARIEIYSRRMPGGTPAVRLLANHFGV